AVRKGHAKCKLGEIEIRHDSTRQTENGRGGCMLDGDETREALRFAEDDDSDDLGGFSRGKRSYEDEEDEENGGWAINEDYSDCLWGRAEDGADAADETKR